MKDMPPRTPYCTFFIKAIDDFMLKLLLVCACVDIGFEVGFAHDDAERKTEHGLRASLSSWQSSLSYLSVHTTITRRKINSSSFTPWIRMEKRLPARETVKKSQSTLATLL